MEPLVHVAGAPHHHEIHCARCGALLYRNAFLHDLDWSEKAIERRRQWDADNPKLAGWLEPRPPGQFDYPYREGDLITCWPMGRALDLAATEPTCEQVYGQT